MIITILAAFFSLIGLMVIHEFGHFVLAKKFGVKVEEFGVGYPPRIFGIKKGETIYSLNLIPFGAFVKVYCEQGGIEDYHSFSGKSMWQRFAIVLGGVVSFWIVAIIILSVVAGAWGLPTEVDDSQNVSNPKVHIAVIIADSPAKTAGLMAGDIVVGFEKISELQGFIGSNKGKEITLTVKRGEDLLEKKIIPRVAPPEGEGPLGIGLARSGLMTYPWYEAPLRGVLATYDLTANVIAGWVMGLKGIMGISKIPDGLKVEFMGPLGIFDLLREYFKMGINYFLFLVALLSTALALANILPIPALDGGKMVFLAIEAIRKKPINHKLEQRVSSVFFALLIIMMIFVTVKFDIPRVF